VSITTRIGRKNLKINYNLGQANPANAVLAPCTPAFAQYQQWSIRSDNTIRTPDGSMCLDVYDCGTADGTNVQVYACHPGDGCNSDANQYWKIGNPSGTGPITTMLDGKCLDVYDFNGPNIDTWDCNGGVNQQWYYNKTDMTLRSEGQCLTVDTAGNLEVWAGPLSGGTYVAALFNRSPNSANITASWTEIGVPSGVAATVRDLWKRRDVGLFTDSYTSEVASHGTVLVKLTPKR